MDLKLLTNEELEMLIYEARNELIDARWYKKLLQERNRRSAEE
jgi:hypothetical protein